MVLCDLGSRSLAVARANDYRTFAGRPDALRRGTSGRLRRHFGVRFIVGKFRISDAFGRTPLTILVFWFRLPSWGFGAAFAVSEVGDRCRDGDLASVKFSI